MKPRYGCGEGEMENSQNSSVPEVRRTRRRGPRVPAPCGTRAQPKQLILKLIMNPDGGRSECLPSPIGWPWPAWSASEPGTKAARQHESRAQEAPESA